MRHELQYTKIDIWYYHIYNIYNYYSWYWSSKNSIKTSWNNMKQLHSHLGGETYEDFHAPTPPPRNHQTTTHSEPKRNVTHRLSDMSCNMEWRSWCSSWRLAIQANKVMPTKSAKFMGTLKIPGGQKLPPRKKFRTPKKRSHFEPPLYGPCTFWTSEYCTEDIAENAWWNARRYIHDKMMTRDESMCRWCCINVNMHQFFDMC